MTFGEKLKKVRLDRGMSQQDFAKLLCTSKQVISRYELGQTTPKIGVAASWCKVLGINLDSMLDDAKDTYEHISNLYHGSPEPNVTDSLLSADLSEHEKILLSAYRQNPDMQSAVDKLLGVDTSDNVLVYRAAHSVDSHPDEIVSVPRSLIQKLEDAPETDEEL